MELQAAITQRTSVRNFKDQSIPVEDIKKMVEFAGCAPSVNNFQPWKFKAITNKEKLKSIADAVILKIERIPDNQSKYATQVKKQVEFYATFFQNAPVLIAISMGQYESVIERAIDIDHDTINRMRNHPDLQSAGAAIQNLLLSAVDMGYGACWMSAPLIAKEEIEELLGIESPDQLVSFVAIGVPANPDKKPKDKKPLDDIFELME